MNVASVHFYPEYGKEPVYAGATGIEEVLNLLKEFSSRLGQPLFVGEFAALGHDREDKLTMEQFRELQTRLLDAFVNEKIDLSAYWVFDYTSDRSGPGLIRKDNKYSWILDQIVEYNEKMQ